MDQSTRPMYQSQENRAARLAGRLIGVLASLALIAACIYLLATGRPDVASWPGVSAGVLGYLLLRPGKRSVRINAGGVVVDLVSDDTGVLKDGVFHAVQHVSQEISERTIEAAMKAGQTGTPPLPLPEDKK